MIIIKYFGTDGIRWRDNKEYEIEMMKKISKGLSYLANKVVISYDTRYTSERLALLLSYFLISKGVDVINYKMSSSCSMRYFCLVNKLVGVNITASHNPYYYNGVKIFNKGNKLSYEEKSQFEVRMDESIHENLKGEYQESNDLIEDYLNYVKKFYKGSKYKIKMDASNGALSDILSELFKDDPMVEVINHNYNGYNINEKCGSTYIESAKVEDGYLFAYDGDGDRLLIRNKDRVFNGNDLIYFLASYYQKYKGLRSVCVEESTNKAYLKAYKKLGIKVFLAGNGDENILKMMNDKGAFIGGEESGHLINKRYLSIGDGLLNALVIINILNEGYLLEDICDYKLNPSRRYNLKSLDIDNVEMVIKKYPCEIIKYRKSGTEDVYRLYIEASSKKRLERLIKELKL